ncbi:protein hypothetical protein [Limosa lapponica baueri]|uniref:Protein Churchill n=1 Tax=Limosa lapponica baueri TaxID=1758121 RepID=A0A2I0TF27_LIMLA|nr:protein hypothetical protein [Limosa lapponica baueri]
MPLSQPQRGGAPPPSPTVPCVPSAPFAHGPLSSTDLCKNCHHLIARHEYTFSVVDDYQEYTMLCLLCGRAEDSISILPDDPRQMTPLF